MNEKFASSSNPTMGASDQGNWESRYIKSRWSATSRTWEDGIEDWRVVGSNPFEHSEYDNIVETHNIEHLHIIEFPSKRLDIGKTGLHRLDINTYVILEADRGEDCGIVKGYTSRGRYNDLIRNNKNTCDDLKIKTIYRIADPVDLLELDKIQKMNSEALVRCNNHVRDKNLKMEVLNCEYQFDLKKITFFYRSDERIDFRELVKDLYKVFKTRIWMCSIDKSKDKLLNDLIGS